VHIRIMPRHVIVYASDDDHVQSFRYYYQTLSRLAAKYGVGRWWIETIIVNVFRGAVEWNSWPKYPMVINTDMIWDTPVKEIERAVSRWVNKFDSLMFLIRERIEYE